VTRGIIIAVLCLVMQGGFFSRPADAAAVTAFDTAGAAHVWGAALAYIAPRSLQKLTIPQMTVWGLNGLAALDPDLNTTLQDGQLRLYGPSALILTVPAPADANDAAAWGKAAASIATAAYNSSPALQTAGTQGVIDNFFDELFNHFDPYSRYEPPQQAALDELKILGPGGTGLTLAAQGGHVVVAAVTVDSPAENAGIAVGSTVLSVDGSNVWPAEVKTLNANMSGLAGSTISLAIQDPDDTVVQDAQDPSAPAVQNFTLTRGYIPEQTVFIEPNLVPGVATLRISGFNEGTADQFGAAMATIMSENPPPQGLVLDLRGNRGGVLRQAVLVADSLLPAGEIAQAQGRDPDATQNFKAEGSDLSNGARLAVLVDGQTASAAEILAAALADNGRAAVIGSETLGKGLVQTITSLPDGGELFVTWSRVLAPRGWPLQSLGVMPQLCTSNGAEAVESQMAALAKGRNLLSPVLDESRAMRAPVGVDEVLALRGHCPASIGTDLDFTAAAWVLQNPTAYQAAMMR
jgi:carboxyl-terminal processing protease